jgi:DNA-binding transcriptional regulator YdaS (Cro superfamily)
MNKEVSQGTASGNEVPVVARRRRHTRSYKLKVLAQADRCTRHGELVALARREGLYASTLNRWKEWRERMQAGETPAKRRSKAEGYETLRNQLRQVERENHRLRMKLKRAELLLDIQKKASEILAEMNRTDESSGSD